MTAVGRLKRSGCPVSAAFGEKQISQTQSGMSAFGSKANMTYCGAHVCL